MQSSQQITVAGWQSEFKATKNVAEANQESGEQILKPNSWEYMTKKDSNKGSALTWNEFFFSEEKCDI